MSTHTYPGPALLYRHMVECGWRLKGSVFVSEGCTELEFERVVEQQ